MKKNIVCSLKSFVMLVVLIGLIGISLGQSSDISDTRFSIGPRISFYQPKDADSSTLYGGAQVRLGLLPSLKLEGSIDYRRSDFGRYINIHVYPVQASVMAYLTPHSIVSPFLLGGIGWYYTQIEGPFNFNNTTNRFGVHAGAGLEVMLNDTLSLDGSYRHLWIENFISRDITAINKEYEDSGSMITIGLNFLF
ncbi:MAG TPA: hypothetical protein DCP53_08650 [Elusimicrobia bacterium]|nr:hypothetical protein [Elusimicrobiota bacterium]